MEKSRMSSGAAVGNGAEPPRQPSPPTGSVPTRRVGGRDPSSLRVQIEALMLDPRGHFRPRALTLLACDGDTDPLLVMQVGEHGDGALSVMTSQPLATGGRFRVWLASEQAQEAASAMAGRRYLLAECRAGHRPEDAGQPCWVSVLRPELDAPLPGEGA